MFANASSMGIWSTRCVDNIVVPVTDRRMGVQAPPNRIQNRPKPSILSERSSAMSPVLSVFIRVARRTNLANTRRFL